MASTEKSKQAKQMEKAMVDTGNGHHSAAAAGPQQLAQYRPLLELSPDPTILYDAEGCVIQVNAAFHETFGWTTAELVGQRLNFVPEAARAETADALARLFKEGKVTSFASKRLTQAGTVLDVLSSGTLLKDEAGNVVGSIINVRDNSQQKETERALQASEVRYRTIIESIEDGYYEADLEGSFTYINDQLCEVIGYPREQLLGMNYRQYTTPETAETVYTTFNQVFKTGEPVKGFVWEAIGKDGRTRHLETYILLRHDEAGNPIGFRGVGRDITQRVQAEEALAEALIDQERIAAQLATVAKISTAVATILDPQEMLQAVVDQIQESFELYHAHVYLLNEAGDMLELVAGAGRIGRQMVQEGRQIPLAQEQSLVARAARGRSGVLVNNVRSDPGFLPHPLLPDTRAEMAVPMIVGKRVLGVIDIQADAVNRFTQRHVNIQTTLATQIAITLQNAQLYAQAQRQTAELQETTLLLDQVIETLPVGLFMKDAHDLRITRWNKENEEITGLPREMVLDKNDYDLFPPEQADFFTSKDREVLSGDDLLDIPEEIIDTPHRGQRVLHTRKIAVLGSDNQPRYLLGISEDITERKQVEESILQSERKYRELVDSLPVGVYRNTPGKAGKLLEVNPALCAIFEAESREEMLRHNVSDTYLNPEDRQRLSDQIMANGFVRNAELQLKTLKGRQIWGSVTAVLKHDENGQPYFDGLLEDITERKQAREAMARQATIMDNAETFLGIGTLEGRIAYINRYGARLLGFENSADVVGRPFAEFQPEAAVDFEAVAIPAILEKGFWRGESVMYAADGRATPVDMTVSFLRDENGRPIGTATNAIDITEQKRAEAALEAALAESERLYEMSAKLNATASIDEILQAVVLPVVAAGATAANLFTIDLDANGRPEWIEMVSAWQDTDAPQLVPVGSRFYLPEFLGATTWIENPDEPVIIGNVPEDPNIGEAAKAIYAMVGVQATVTIPLRLGQQWVGLLVISWLTPQEFTPQQVRLYKSLADQTAVILNNRLLFEQTQKRAAELATVAEVGAAITTIRNVDELLQQVVDLTKDHFALYHAHIYLLDSAENNLVLTSGAGDVGRRMVAEGRIIPLHQEQSLIARAARTRQGVIVNDVTADTGFLPHPLLPQTKAEMAVPIVVADEVLGVLDVQGERTGRFTEEDIRTQTTLAAQIGVALQNARSFARSEAALRELEEVTRRLRREGWQSYLDSGFAEGMAYGYDQKEVMPLKLAEPIRSKTKKKKDEQAAMLAQPLLVQGEAIGKLVLTEPGSLEDDAADIMTAVAERLSAHIENLRLSEQTEQARQQAELLFQGSAALNTAQSYDDVLTALRQHTIIGSPGMNSCTINYFDRPWTNEQTPEWVELLSRYSLLPLDSLPMRFPFAMFATMSSLLQPDAPTLIEDIATDQRLDDSGRIFFQNFFQAESVIFVPLVIGSQWVGLINAIYSERTTFPEAEVRRLMTLSQQATVALQSIRLFAQARARAERERQVRTITDKIRRGTDRENILQIAREELAQMLGASKTVARLGSDVKLLAKVENVDEVELDGRNPQTENYQDGL
jgi:PAS domain S-box-containing protein